MRNSVEQHSALPDRFIAARSNPNDFPHMLVGQPLWGRDATLTFAPIKPDGTPKQILDTDCSRRSDAAARENTVELGTKESLSHQNIEGDTQTG
jgi:hypothetical protein